MTYTPLKTCPFCNRPVRMIEWPNLDLFFAWCQGCEASGPRKRTETEAVVAWNSRVAPAPAQHATEEV